MMGIIDIKSSLCEKRFYELLAPSVFDPTEQRLQNRAKKYQFDETVNVFAYKQKDEYEGIIVFRLLNSSAQILDIAVKPECQGRGVGSAMIDFVFNSFHADKIIAETDSDAVGFYLKIGFSVDSKSVKYDTERFTCVKYK